MNNIGVPKRYINRLLLFGITLPLLIIPGCSKESSESKNYGPVIWPLTEIIKKPELSADAKSRAKLAISQWQNDFVDSKPILIHAKLGQPKKVDKTILGYIIFDEDRDTVGFVIKEEHVDSNGVKTVLEEDYPAYVHCLPFEVVDAHWVSIQIRDKHQRKDEKLWSEYVNTDFEHLVKKHVSSNDLSTETFYQGKFWEDTLPPVWVSMPEPNKVDVWVYVYDKAGNSSEPLKLLNFTNNNKKNYNK